MFASDPEKGCDDLMLQWGLQLLHVIQHEHMRTRMCMLDINNSNNNNNNSSSSNTTTNAISNLTVWGSLHAVCRAHKQDLQ